MNIKQTTKLLSKIDKNSTPEVVWQIFNNARFVFPIPKDTLCIGEILYRATVVSDENEIVDINRLSYKPACLNKSYGRASTLNNTMFYGLSSNNEEMGILGSMSEVCHCIKNYKTAEEGHYKVVVSKWKIVSEIIVAIISDPYGENRSVDVKDPIYGRLLNSEQKDFVKLISNSFRKEVANENKYEYWISAIFTEFITQKYGFEGVVYESVQSSPLQMQENLCIALCPKIADKCLNFIGGDLYEFDFVKGKTIVPKVTKNIIQIGGGKIQFVD